MRSAFIPLILLCLAAGTGCNPRLRLKPEVGPTDAQEQAGTGGVCDSRNFAELSVTEKSSSALRVADLDAGCPLLVQAAGAMTSEDSASLTFKELRVYANGALIFHRAGELGRSFSERVRVLENTSLRGEQSVEVRAVATDSQGKRYETKSLLASFASPGEKSGERGVVKKVSSDSDRRPFILFPDPRTMFLSFYLDHIEEESALSNNPDTVLVCIRKVSDSSRNPALFQDTSEVDDPASQDSCLHERNGWKRIHFSTSKAADGFPAQPNTFTLRKKSIHLGFPPPVPEVNDSGLSYWVGRFSAFIQPLEPDTFYEYRVAQLDWGQHRMLANRVVVHTPQERGTDKELYVAAIADLSMMDDYNSENGEGQLKVRAQLQKFVDAGMVDLTILPGDISNNDGSARKYFTRYFNIYEDLIDHVPFYPIHGNHDLNRASGFSANVWGYDFFTMFELPRNSPANLLTHVGPHGDTKSGYRSFYSFDWGNTHFGAYDVPAIMDVEEGDAADDPNFQDLHPTASQLGFIDADLGGQERSAGRWNISYFHEPLNLSLYSDDANRNHQPLIQAMQGRVDLVVNGHAEFPAIQPFNEDGKAQLPGIVLPSGGARWRCHDPKYDGTQGCDAGQGCDARYGFSLIRVTHGALYVTFFDLEGRPSGELKVTRPDPAGPPVSKEVTPLRGCPAPTP